MGLHVHRILIAAVMAALLLVPQVPAAFGVHDPALSGQAPGAVYASVSDKTLDKATGNTGDMLAESADSAGWPKDANWVVLARARAGLLTAGQAKKYYNNVLDVLKTTGSPQLSETQSSDNSKIIMALTAAGYRADNIGGYNLVEPLADMDFVLKQGMNGPVWALLAVDSGGYTIPKLASVNSSAEDNAANAKKQTTRDGLIAAILASHRSDGGWAYSGMSSDVDMTCMAIQSLAPYYNTNREVHRTVDVALAWLRSVQNQDGSFSSGGYITSESASQVIVALTSLGIDPAKDVHYLKNGKGALDSLLSFYVRGGGFKHIYDNDKSNGLASVQAYYALVAYYRYRDGQTSLYDMSDAGTSDYVMRLCYQREDTAGGGNDSGDPAEGTKPKPSNNKDKNPGQTRNGSSIKMKAETTEQARASINSIKTITTRSLPADAAGYSEADIKAIEDAYLSYQKLTPAERLAVEQDASWKKYCEITAKLGQVRHADAASGIDMRGNTEETLPWTVALQIHPWSPGKDKIAQVQNLLGEGGELGDMYDICFLDHPTGKTWHPKGIVTVRMPAEKTSEGEVIVHICDSGKIEFLDGKRIADDQIEYQATSFSPYGIATMEGSVDDLITVPEETGKTQDKPSLLPWIVIAGVAILAVIALVAARRRLLGEPGGANAGQSDEK